MRAEPVTDPICEHGEGPVWHAGWPGLRWVDMLAGDVLELDAATGQVRRRHVDTVAAALRPIAGGGAILAVTRGFAVADDDLTTITHLGELWSDPEMRMNEGGCDPDGRFYCGSMAYEATTGRGSLYRLDGDGTATVVLRGLSISNGLAWSPDGSTAYYVDTPTQRIDAFDYDRNTGLTGRRPVVHIPEEDGSPDGLTVDRDGNLWVALWDGSAVRGYSPDGTLRHEVRLPATQVTACTFGGPDLRTLYVTTSQRGVDRGEQPDAGAVFAVDVGAAGQPVLPHDRNRT